MSSDLPVIIVGAGPVGLSLATALVQKNIPVQVYEKRTDLSPEARASTFHPRTLEMFAEWGVLDTVLNHGYRVDYLQYWERASRKLIAQFDYDVIAKDTPYPFRIQCPQSVLTRLLRPHVESSAFGQVYMNHSFVSAQDLGDSVIARFDTPQGQKEVRGRFLCGADGAHSAVREDAGIEFEGKTYHDRFLLIACDLDFQQIYPDLGPVSYLFDPREWVIVLQLPDVTRVVFRLPEDENAIAVQEHDAIRDRIHNFTGLQDDFTIYSTSIYNVHQRVATRMRQGNTILLGDAAHINNPMGGMGMNSGIHDAYHLSNVLERIREGEGEYLLDEYSQDRRAYAIGRIWESTDKNYRDMASTDETYRQERNQHFQQIAQDKAKMREYLLKRSMLDDRIKLGVS